MNLKVKICGLTRREDMACAARYGADYLGVVAVASSPRCVALPDLERLFAAPPAPTVLVVRDMDLNELLDLVARLKPHAVQLHGGEPPEYARRISGVEVWKAIKLRSLSDVDRAADYPAQLIVADGGSGGSGITGDWRLAAMLARRKKVLLAGGLTPDNALEARKIDGIYGVDTSSGTEETCGIKSSEKIKYFIERIKS